MLERKCFFFSCVCTYSDEAFCEIERKGSRKGEGFFLPRNDPYLGDFLLWRELCRERGKVRKEVRKLIE